MEILDMPKHLFDENLKLQARIGSDGETLLMPEDGEIFNFTIDTNEGPKTVEFDPPILCLEGEDVVPKIIECVDFMRLQHQNKLSHQ